MQYKGDDLDLRVPLTRQSREAYGQPDELTLGVAGNGRWSRQGYQSGGNETLWVDEILLACCNYAYDVAAANGAGEVELEHLVNALTRVDSAARILEARGVREGQLRRDSAALIASEIPIATAGERVTPRRSAVLEDVLRRAVEQAGRRGSAATVDDVLWIILHYGRDLPAVLLLRRLTPEWQRLDWSRLAMPAREPEPAMAPAPPRIVVPAPMVHAGSSASDALAARMSLIEDSLRALHAELASERKALGDLLRDTQRDIVAQRGDAASLRSDLAQRLEALERGVQSQGRTDSGRAAQQLADRFQSLEKAVHSGLGEGARNWAAMVQRLQSIEGTLETPADISRPLQERLAAVEQLIEGRLSQSSRVWTGFTDRLQSVERLIEAGAGEGGRQWTALSERIAGLEAQLKARPPAGPLPELATLTERLGGLERAVRTGFGDSVQMTQRVSERVEALEKIATAEVAGDGTDGFMVVDDRIQSIERMLQDQLAGQGKGAVPLDAAPIVTAVTERLAVVEKQVAERNEATLGAVREATARLAALEQRVGASTAERAKEAAARDGDIADLHDAIVRLSENQSTLASAIGDWRYESHSDFSSVNAQLERLAYQPATETVGQPMAADLPLPNVARGSVGSSLSRAEQAARDNRRPPALQPVGQTADPLIEPAPVATGRGFWWWLFGTGSIAEANREAEIRWQKMHERLREARDRRRERA